MAETPRTSITDIGIDSQYQRLGESDRRNATLYSAGLSAMYMFDQTYAATVGYNNWYGDKNAAYYGTDNGSPNSDAWTFQIDWMPFNKDGAPGAWPRSNLKLSLQYVAYSKFDGSTKNASDNNTLFIGGWLAF